MRSFSGPHFPSFGLDTDLVQMLENAHQKTPNMDTFYVVGLVSGFHENYTVHKVFYRF